MSTHVPWPHCLPMSFSSQGIIRGGTKPVSHASCNFFCSKKRIPDPPSRKLIRGPVIPLFRSVLSPARKPLVCSPHLSQLCSVQASPGGSNRCPWTTITAFCTWSGVVQAVPPSAFTICHAPPCPASLCIPLTAAKPLCVVCVTSRSMGAKG